MRQCLAAIVALAVGMGTRCDPAWSQNAPPAPPPPPVVTAASDQPLSEAQLDQLLAPVALYPDTLLAQVLMAATYPLEVVEANRWVQDPAHAALKGDPLTAALQPLSWDPSVKSLVPFPRVLQMMDSRLDWMQAVGDAFVAQQAAVMDSVQRLRQRAQAAGTLASTPHETVGADDGAITIEPADQNTVYVPVYYPGYAYAPWPWTDYPPFWFPPPPGFDLYGDAMLWWDVPIIWPLWGWAGWHWHDHGLYTRPGRFHGWGPGHAPMAGGAWQHDPAHRLGVPYRGAATAQRFGRGAPEAATVPRLYRGFDTGDERRAEPQRGETRPAEHAAPPLFESYGAGRSVRGESARGFSSGVSGASRSFGGGSRPR